jgi:hypothetical protein
MNDMTSEFEQLPGMSTSHLSHCQDVRVDKQIYLSTTVGTRHHPLICMLSMNSTIATIDCP